MIAFLSDSRRRQHRLHMPRYRDDRQPPSIHGLLGRRLPEQKSSRRIVQGAPLGSQVLSVPPPRCDIESK